MNENKEYAVYMGSNDFFNEDKVVMCSIGDKGCAFLFDFEELIKPYMNE